MAGSLSVPELDGGMKGERRGRSAAWHRRAARVTAPLAHSAARPQPAWESEKPGEGSSGGAGVIGKALSTGYCRLCHGKFSSRSLRNAFGKFPVIGRSSEKQRRLDQVFYADFQQLVGVSVRKDPELPQFVCKDCHAQFYKCRSVLRTFIQRVNTSPTKPHSSRADSDLHNEVKCTTESCTDLITSSSDCLLGLVSWTHSHAGSCHSLPSLQQVLSTQYCGIIRAVWGCNGGHDYIMEMDSDTNASPTLPGHVKPTLASAHAVRNRTRVSHETRQIDGNYLSDGDFQGREIREEQVDPLSSDDCFEELTEKRRDLHKRKESGDTRKSPSEPRPRKKPGPKPGWNKIKQEREELPPIYKCPHQGCTAVYRGADGMKKHVKEQHEEVRERPCPHPGCNKVFMIDRYLQRHVKLIHTEQRNYICDQCGQAFKQRKHLSVHQMRHSGAKPLQCEVCGFQCRQRASLKYHMTKHKAESDLEFACDQCGKRFEKAHNLNVHMSMVHPLIQIPATEAGREPNVPSGATEGQPLTEIPQEPPP
ncbi:zinc finger 276 isoform X1 [Pelobates cultripes]|uniref:Zinc finger protein 276 n=1 Tax=Pelobates cultripes TaxID=61616 RepID=A0AAD1TDB5_PELCU|nr:zinc finger 276 isoform X1 [Pelobates cultripes]